MYSRRFIHLLFTTIVAVLAVLPAAAAPPDTSMTRTTSVFLTAFSPEAGVDAFLFRHPGGGYLLCIGTPAGTGCADVAADAVQLDADTLTSATVAPTMIQLQRCDAVGNCEPGDAVTVALTFTGTGELTKFQNRFKSSNGCKLMGSSKGVQRAGAATITINDETYNAEAFLAIARETFKVQCRG